ncbi:MAG: nuclear transport factor 2 family protein [Acidimicrobiales bacterium]|nr:nuclear transport factor 2 family protein [Acidimicrobiales bacterium]
MATDPKTVVVTALDRLNEHDLEGYYALCADDFTYTGTGTRRGKDEARATDEPLFAALPDHWRRIEKLLVSGNTVVVWLTFGGTPAATGKSFESEFCDVIEVDNGLITSLTMYADWPTLMSKLAPS